jgi:hypothetical protein
MTGSTMIARLLACAFFIPHFAMNLPAFSRQEGHDFLRPTKVQK